MTWQPGKLITSTSDYAEWHAWCKSRRLEQQRQRRQKYPRIDYYPSQRAIAVIRYRMRNHASSKYSGVIDQLILATMEKIPE